MAQWNDKCRRVRSEMAKQNWKPGNMLYPLPAVLVSCQGNDGKPNLITIGWVGTICSDPAMVSISVRPERYSFHMLKETGEFVINLTTEELLEATDYCGVASGRDVNKWEKMNLTPIPSEKVSVPAVAESPINIECKVTEVKELGTHHMFIAEVVNVRADEKYMDEKGKFHLEYSKPIAYSHGTYFALGEELGKFGYSVRKK